MLQLLLTFFCLAGVIVVAGTFLSRFADVIAHRTGIGRTLGGIVLLAAATSLPELAVDCKAAVIGAADLAVGAVLGSSIFNLLILGVLDLCYRGKHRIISPASAGHALAAISTVILTSIVLAFIVLKDLPLEWMSIGLGTFLVFVFYCGGLRLIYFDQRFAQSTDEPVSHGEDDMRLGKAVMGYCCATAAIFIAAAFLAPTADRLATVTGLGGTFIGSTMVALTTSLPEVVTSIAAIRMGAFDLAVGNVLGSNAFNMAILLPVDLCYRPGSLLAAADMNNAFTAAAAIMLTAVFTVGLLYRPKRRNWLLEPGAGLLVVLAVAAFVALYYLVPAAA